MAITSIQITQTQTLFRESVPEDVVTQALKDAGQIIELTYCIDESDTYYDLALRYYACHLLYMNGHIKEATSKSVGDVSVGYSTVNQGDKENTSPCFAIFEKIIEDGGIFTSI